MEELDLVYMEGFNWKKFKIENGLYVYGKEKWEINKIIHYISNSIINIIGNHGLLITFGISGVTKDVYDSMIIHYRYNKRKQIIENI